jgi:hypothetical protein
LIRKLKLPQNIMSAWLELYDALHLRLLEVEKQPEKNLQEENLLRRVLEELYDQMCEYLLQQREKPFPQVRENLQRMHQHMQWPREDQLRKQQPQQEQQLQGEVLKLMALVRKLEGVQGVELWEMRELRKLLREVRVVLRQVKRRLGATATAVVTTAAAAGSNSSCSSYDSSSGGQQQQLQ